MNVFYFKYLCMTRNNLSLNYKVIVVGFILCKALNYSHDILRRDPNKSSDQLT